jgi:hypothetical protein
MAAAEAKKLTAFKDHKRICVPAGIIYLLGKDVTERISSHCFHNPAVVF